MLMTNIVLFPLYRWGSYRSKVVRNISKPAEVYRVGIKTRSTTLQTPFGEWTQTQIL